MNALIITSKKLYLQKDFDSQSQCWLKECYSVAGDEKLLCAVWVSPLVRWGFLLTDKALRWRLPGAGLAKPVSGFLKKAAVAQTDFALSRGEGGLQLDIGAAEGRISFLFTLLAEEQVRTLFDILRFGYLQGTVPQTDLQQLIKNMPCTAFRARLDGAQLAVGRFFQKLAGLAGLQKRQPVAAGSIAGAGNNAGAGSVTALLSFCLLFACDVLASLFFIAAVVIAIKPVLLAYGLDSLSAPDFFQFFCWQGDYFKLLVFRVPPSELASADGLLIWRNLFVLAFLAVFVLLKLLVVFASRNSGRKIVSVLMIAMTILACSLVADKLLIFMAFCLLIYAAFEYSCGLGTRTMLIKLSLVFLFSVVGYIVAHLVMDDACYALVTQTLQRFSLPSLRWL